MNRIVSFLILFYSWTFGLDINFSLESKYGDGSKITKQDTDTPDTLKYNFFENLLNINTNLSNGIFISTQFEFSNPPIFGESKTGFNNFTIDYYKDRLYFKVGSIYSLYGRGLSLNMIQNQDIDYDNSVIGTEIKYDISEKFSLIGIWGLSDFKYRNNPVDLIATRSLDNTIYFLGSEYFTQDFGIFQFSFLQKESVIDSTDISLYAAGVGNRINDELRDRIENDNISISSSDILSGSDYNFIWSNYIYGCDLYLEKVWSQYNKILGDKIPGSKLYFSMYFEIFETGITYEYKNYDQKYLIQTISGPPTVFYENNTSLASRNVHSVNWGDEIGHQISLNRLIYDKINWMFSLSFSKRHEVDGLDPVNLFDNLKMNNVSSSYYQSPYRQIYTEFSSYIFEDKLSIKLGIDQFDEIRLSTYIESVSALTFPLMLSLGLDGGHSITAYLENQIVQNQKFEFSTLLEYEDKKRYNNYLSATFSFKNKFSLSAFYEAEEKDQYNIEDYPEFICNDSASSGWIWDGTECVKLNEKDNKWIGYDFSYKINSTSQLSLFYGSQKGGLVCANGVCAEQPGFDDGIKVTLRTIF